MKSRLSKRAVWVAMALVCVLAVGVVGVAFAANKPLKKGLKVFVIPKQLGNSYFTTADSVKTGGALAALKTLGETGSETSGKDATAASQIPAIQAAISKGANALVVSATDPKAICPTLKKAMKKKHRRRHVRRRRADVPQHVHQPGRHGGHRRQRGRPAGQGDPQDRQDRDRVGGRFGAEPERVDRLHEEGAQEVPEHEARLDGLRQR